MFERVFGTFTNELEQLADWLKEHKVKQVAMESTGVYWIPVWNVLEAARWKLELTLVNPQTVKALQGAKTDRIDAARIAELFQFGLLRGSFVPPKPIRQLRDLTRMRVHQQQDRNRIINRITRLLETANVKLSSVASNVVGKTGRAILQALIDGVTKPERMAELAKGSLREKKEELALALEGRFSGHFRWLLGELVDELERLDKKIEEIDERLSQRMTPHEDLIRRLSTIPGVSRLTAWMLIAELGVDMSQFATAAHVASWAGLCPGNSESAGKRMSGRTRKGNRYLRRILTQSAWSVTHKKDCFLTALFRRLSQKRGAKKAIVAVAHRMIILAYHIIRDGVEYREVGGDYFDQRDPERTRDKLIRRMERMGYQVEVTGTAAGLKATPAGSSPSATVPRRPGRPCHCAKRGIACVHRRSATKSPPSAGAASKCPMCARWGIDCIHARNQFSETNKSGNPAES